MTATAPDAVEDVPRPRRVSAEVWAMLRLAGPVIVARAGLVIMMTVDTLMVGMADAHQIAYLGLGLSAVSIFMMLGVGLLQGAMILTAQANGAGEYARCGAIWRVALIHGFLLGSLFFGLSFLAEPAFLAIGHAPDLAAHSGDVAVQFGWGIPGMMMYVATGYLLEGIGRPKAAMVIMLLANVANIPLNGIFVLGWGDLVTPMGATGAMMTTSALRWAIFFAILLVVLTMKDRGTYGITGTRTPFWPIARRIWTIGTPVAATGTIENGSYSVLAQMAGLLGTAAMAAHQVTMNVQMLCYMGANGMAAATSVRVGHAVGRGDRAALNLSGWTGIALGPTLMALFGAIFLLAPHWIADLFLHTDEASLAIAAHTIRAAGVFIIVAGALAVAMGALRGLGDMLPAMAAYALGFLVFGLPMAWVFAFRLELGAPGLIYGLTVGAFVAVLALLWRFRTAATRPLRRA